MTGSSRGNRQAIPNEINPSLRGRMFNRSIALETVQVSNRRSRSRASREWSPLVGGIADCLHLNRSLPCTFRPIPPTEEIRSKIDVARNHHRKYSDRSIQRQLRMAYHEIDAVRLPMVPVRILIADDHAIMR